MNRILFINLGDYGSTGKIIDNISNLIKENGDCYLKCYPESINSNKSSNDAYIICNNFIRKYYLLLSMIGKKPGTISKKYTYRLIEKINEFKPNIIHLHNIHNNFINFEIFFNYLGKTNIRIIWTFHDCWPFTGRCSHFDSIGCSKWKTGCNKCEYPKSKYPETLFDYSNYMWILKKELFSNVKNLTIVTPSLWLSNLVKESFFKNCRVVTINNGIDLNIFKPRESNFIKRSRIERKKIILGVSFGWNYYKGIDVFVKLCNDLDDSYQIVLVGVDSKLSKSLPKRILKIERTRSQEELVDIYNACNLFVNPTREETFSLVNLEALACGTPVITFDSGGCSEVVNDTVGKVVKKNDYQELIKQIKKYFDEGNDLKENCLKRAREFDQNVKYKEYMKLYNE